MSDVPTIDIADMMLPLGMTCLDCQWWTRCHTVLGVAQPGQQTCDWSPSRFQQRSAAPTCPGYDEESKS